uniref:Glucosidase 2 subunit beta n=1 Tax=Paramormyrops kingsleyae TaxID=1676925 RepID=A0A3B3T7D1_9TELE
MFRLQVFLIVSLGAALGAAVEVQRPRGVPLEKRHFYDESRPFTCLDGSRTIPFDRVNDDYCDCKDGSDEPGTAACPNGSFHCTNAGFRATFIPSSRINDGVCDCCDTTDEYNSGVSCQNTCRELGQKERETLEKMAEITREGFLLKRQLIEEAKQGLQEKQGKLSELQASRKEHEEKVDALRTVKETAEQPEREAKERHLKAWEAQKAALQLEKEKAKMAEVFLELDGDADGLVSVSELQTHQELDPDGDGALTDTEAQGLLSGADKVDSAGFQNVWSNIKDKYVSEVRGPSCLLLKSGETDFWLEVSVHSYPEDDAGDEEDDEEEDDDDDVPEEYDDKVTCHRCRPMCATCSSLPESLEKEISFDFGPSAEFAYLYSQCYELTTNEYIYRLCPFNRVSQKPKYGGSETNLGSWGSWNGPEGSKYSIMKYDHGTGCWQGPNRSTTVKLTCGKETAVLSTSEPSRCEYLMEFSTPAICQEPPSLETVAPETDPHDEF